MTQARTRLARTAVVDAARSLFLERGYGTTTVEAISERAGVPPATVYRLFASKLGILKALLDTSIAGDDAGISVPNRPNVKALFDLTDPREQLTGFVGITRDINARSAPLYEILAGAVRVDADADALLDEYSRQRHEGQRRIARSLARLGALRTDVRAREAEDIIHALMSPEVYRLLVVERGWTPKRYADWLSATLIAQLLR